MGITIFKIFKWGVYRRINVRKSRFTAPLMRCRKTEFPTVYPTIYLPKWKFWIQLSPKSFDVKQNLCCNQLKYKLNWYICANTTNVVKRVALIKFVSIKSFHYTFLRLVISDKTNLKFPFWKSILGTGIKICQGLKQFEQIQKRDI